MTAIDVAGVNSVRISNAVLCGKAVGGCMWKRVCSASGVVTNKETALEEVAAPHVAIKLIENMDVS
jgi:hypothetical protein